MRLDVSSSNSTKQTFQNVIQYSGDALDRRTNLHRFNDSNRRCMSHVSPVGASSSRIVLIGGGSLSSVSLLSSNVLSAHSSIQFSPFSTAPLTDNLGQAKSVAYRRHCKRAVSSQQSVTKLDKTRPCWIILIC